MDIEKFHRTCPVIPAHKPWLVVQGEPGDFFIDHANPFGLASASSNAGQPGNGTVDILRAVKVHPVPKYEDDLSPFRRPTPDGRFFDAGYRYDYDKAEILRRIAPLLVPWHKEKGSDFAFTTTFISFFWNITEKTVSLPNEKRLKFCECVRRFIDEFSGHQCHFLDVEKIHGSLCHVAFVYLDGRSRLPSLSNFASSFHDDEYKTRYPPHSMLTDLRWWFERLSQEGYTRLLRPKGPLQDLGIFVDASTSWGIGIIIGAEWAAFRLSSSWKIAGRDICWLETVAVELLAYFLEAKGIRDAHLLIHSDNTGTIGALGKGRSGNSHINLSVCRTHLIFADLAITPQTEYIESAANPADPISRGEPGLAGRQTFPTFELPDELRDSFCNV